ncbi:TonB-dependent receptor [Spirosoma soli]|uniref:TonB-dependent receptor n=1 Tax=Spirosoma soli TaxID=1770529 RepID=A0ABW5M8Y2_9BACT
MKKPLLYDSLVVKAMRISICHLLLIILGSSFALAHDSKAQELLQRKVSLQLRDQSLKKVLQAIEKQANVKFLYRADLIQQSQPVTVLVNEKTVEEVLSMALRPSQLTYNVSGRQIVLTRLKPIPAPTAPTSTVDNAQAAVDQSVKGRITSSDNGEGLPGVSILIKGTTKGTTTNADGDYQLVVPNADAVLVFSFVGYESQEIPVGNRTEINVSLKADVKGLNEVVVVGYGTVAKRDLTGAVNSVDNDKLRETTRTNPYQALQGQAAGVDIRNTSNKPGGGFQVQIRGFNSIGRGSSPLFVVDGIFVNDITNINPADIQKIDILKDASATAIYGSRGANGVVIVSTVRGKAGKAQVQYDAYVGSRSPTNLPRMFTGDEFVQFAKDAAVGVGKPDLPLDQMFSPNELTNIQNKQYADWPRLLLSSGLLTNHTLGVSGGGDGGLLYSFGGGFTSDQGTISNENYKRYNLRASISKSLTSWLEIGHSGYASYEIRNDGSNEALRSAYRLRPTGSVYDANGQLQFFPSARETQITNPLFEPENENRETRYLKYFGSLYLKINPVQGVEFRTSIAPDIEFNRFGQYDGVYTKNSIGQTARTLAQYNSNNRLAYTWDNIVNLEKTIGGIHNIKASLISSLWSSRSDGSALQVRDFATDAYSFYNVGAGKNVQVPSTYFVQEQLAAFVGRVNYAFKDKYLFTVTGRYDGSSKLAAGKQWKFFPSAAFAWRLNDEAFLKNTAVNDLKLRLSYGQAGNNNINAYSSQAGVGAGFYAFGNDVAPASTVNNLANQNLTWETTKELNLGVDYGFFNSRISGSVDVYRRVSDGLILTRQLPAITGYTSVVQNIGSVQNTGIEVSLNTVNVKTPSFQWRTTLNLAHNKNAIQQLYGDSKDDIGNGWFIGQPVNVNYDYVWDGIWQTSEADQAKTFGQKPGQIKVKDLNGDGKITSADRQIIGSPLPTLTGGITNNFTYRNFDFAVFAYTRQNLQMFSVFHNEFAFGQDELPARFNGLKIDYWTPTNPINTWFQPGNAGPYKNVVRFQNTSFVKIGYITLGYTLPKDLLSRLKMQTARVYFTAQNPFVFTKYAGWDPEIADQSSFAAAVMNRTLLGGISIKF